MKDKKITLLDGAMGTYLEKKGYKGITPELACIEIPEIIEEIHTEYVESGSEIILTNTFGANTLRLGKKNIDKNFKEINEKAVEIAKKVKEKYKNIMIAGDIGPTGEMLYPYGVMKENDCKNIFLSQAKLYEGKVDLVVLETFTDLEELKIAYSSIRGIFKTVVPCLSFQMGKEYRTMMGNTIDDYVKWAEEENIEIIGTNCGVGSEQMKEIVEKISGLTDKNLWVKPNAGIPHLVEGKVIYPESKNDFAENCLSIVKNHNVKFIGGCCGTDPSYIKHLKEKIYENS